MSIQEIDDIMDTACELCHYPYAVQDQEQLDRICEDCPLRKQLEEL